MATLALGCVLIGTTVLTGLYLRIKYRYITLASSLFVVLIVVMGAMRGKNYEWGLGTIHDCGGAHFHIASEEQVAMVFAVLLLIMTLLMIGVWHKITKRRRAARPAASRAAVIGWVALLVGMYGGYVYWQWLNPNRLLHLAIRSGDVARVREILKAHPDLCDRPYWLSFRIPSPPLYRAISQQRNTDINIIELLLDHGADPNLSPYYEESPLVVAARRGRTDLVQLLLDKGADADAHGISSSPLQAAVVYEHMGVFELLLNHGVQLDRYGQRVLFVAIRMGRHEMARRLIDRGVAVDGCGGDAGSTALHAAVASFDPQMVRLVLDHSSDVDVRDKCGTTPLMTVLAATATNRRDVAAERLQIAKLLLDAGADVNAKGGLYASPLHSASAMNRLPIFELLVDRGANVNALDKRGRTPLDYVLEFNPDSRQIEPFLRGHGARLQSEIQK